MAGAHNRGRLPSGAHKRTLLPHVRRRRNGGFVQVALVTRSCSCTRRKCERRTSRRAYDQQDAEVCSHCFRTQLDRETTGKARCNLPTPLCGLLFEYLWTDRMFGRRVCQAKGLDFLGILTLTLGLWQDVTVLDAVHPFPCSSPCSSAHNHAKAVFCRLWRLEHRRCRFGCATFTSFCKGAKAAACPGTRILGPSKHQMVRAPQLTGCVYSISILAPASFAAGIVY